MPVLRGKTPRDWRTSMYYRYYHDPGHHNTRAHYGVRTQDAQADLLLEEGPVGAVRPGHGSAGDAQPVRPAGQAALTATLKTELARLKREAKDDDQLADVQIPQGVDGTVAQLRGE